MALTILSNLLCGSLLLAQAGADPVAIEQGVQIRNTPGASSTDTTKAIRSALAVAEIERRDDESFSRWADLESNWDNAPMLHLDGTKSVQAGPGELSLSASVDIICKTCYLKGNASVELTIDRDYNISSYVDEVYDTVRGLVQNITDEAEGIFTNFIEETNVTNWRDAEWPSFDNISLEIGIPPAPEANLKFRFDDLDLYLEIDSYFSLGATYEIQLYPPKPYGGVKVAVGSNLTLDVNFGVTLILSVEGYIDVSSGVHLKLDDGVELNVALFGDEVSDVNFNGGQFEFLPVTLSGAGTIFTAVLRVGAHAGLNIVEPENAIFDTIKDVVLPTFQGGIEVGVHADVAKFLTNITLTPQNETCKLHAVQEYTVALGATAAATFQIDDVAYGPTAAPSIDIWYTTMASTCVIEGPPTRTPSSVLAVPTISRRQVLETTTLSTEVVSAVIGCMTPTSGSCPASLQTTVVNTETIYLTTAVPSDETALWSLLPTTTANPIGFGTNALSLATITGSPSAYTPPPPSPTSSSSVISTVDNILDGEVSGVSNKIIIGLCVGLGLPLLVAIATIIILCLRRRKYTAVPHAAKNEPIAAPASSQTHGY